MSSHNAKNVIPEDWIEKIEQEKNKPIASEEERRVLYDFIKKYYKSKTVLSMSKACGKGVNTINKIKMQIVEEE